MSIKWIPAAWQTYLKTYFPQDHRVYIDFRQQQYPEIAGSPTFTVMTAADNKPGSHNFTGGYANYLLDMSSTFTLDVYFKPTFAFNVGSNQYLWAWYIGSSYLLFRYDQTTDKYMLIWRDGGAEKTMVSSAYVSNVTLQVWTRATFSIDLTTGTTAGSAFYLEGVLISDTWSGASDIKVSKFPILNVRNLIGSIGTYTINYLRLFQSKTSVLADVTSNFKDFKEEEIVWHYNGVGMGHTRCGVYSRVNSVDIERTCESPAGNANPNSATVNLLSPQGQFADDQYGAFAPASEVYNGDTQKYLQQRCPIEIEIWYSGLFELEFTGRVDEAMFTRASSFQTVSQVSLGAKDFVDDIKRRVRQKAYGFDSYNLSDPASASASLLHVIAKMATEPEWYNFAANSGFENATIGNSWVAAGGGATLTRAAGGLMGSWQGDLLCATAGSITQTVTFSGVKKLDVGQNWNLSGYIKTATACTFALSLIQASSAGTSITTTTTSVVASAGVNWQKIEATGTISTSTVAILKIQGVATASTVSLDTFMLIQNGKSLNWAFTTTNDGVAGTVNADNAQSSVFDMVGFDVDDAAITVPFTKVEQGKPVWDYLKDISDATAARYMGMDACGTLKYRAPFKAGYVDPSSLFTVSALQMIQSAINIQQANKIVIHGVQVLKDSAVTLLWSAEKTSFFARDANGYLYEAVANGATWPDPATYGEFWATYDTTVRTS